MESKFKKVLSKVVRKPVSPKKYEALTGSKYEGESDEDKLRYALDEAKSENEKLRVRQRAKMLGIKLD